MLCVGVAQGPGGPEVGPRVRGRNPEAPGASRGLPRPRGAVTSQRLSGSRVSGRSRVWRWPDGALQGQVCAPVPACPPVPGGGAPGPSPAAEGRRLRVCGRRSGTSRRTGGQRAGTRAPARRGAAGRAGRRRRAGVSAPFPSLPGGGARARAGGAVCAALGRSGGRPGSLGIKLPGVRLPPGFYPGGDARRCLRFPPLPAPH